MENATPRGETRPDGGEPAFPALHRLRDGTSVRLRLVGPADREQMLAGFERLSPESRYWRFFTAMPRLSPALLTRLTDTDGHDHLAIGAELRDEDGGPLVGVARFIRLGDAPDTAEASVAVVDDLQRRGLGRLLLRQLSAAARAHGIRTFRAHVLGGNDRMRALLRDIDAHPTVSSEAGMLVYDFALPPPQDEAAGAGLVFEALRVAAKVLHKAFVLTGIEDDAPSGSGSIRSAPEE
jgi:RimJ/RimL family protein N-acetyltransferase